MSTPPAPGPSDQAERFCPVCGRRTPEPQCPVDRSQTVEIRSFGRNPRSYQPGDIVNERYRITGPLGAGGFAAIYAAEHLGTHQELAIKLMAAEPGQAGEVATRRFFREAKVTASLQHPNTVRVFDVGQDIQGPLFMAMELIRGRTLHAELRERILAKMLFSQEEVVDLGIQVLDSLAEAHRYQLVHRDLKPANLMLTDGEGGTRVVKVLDFGIAQTSDSSLTATGAAPGTPAFMSPEQCKGDEVDGRSDLYSLATVMFACVAGRLPFEHKEPLRLMQMHVMTPAPDPRTVSTTPLTNGFVAVLLQALAKKPSERFATAAEMRAALLGSTTSRDEAATALQGMGDQPTEHHVMPLNPTPRLRPGASGGFPTETDPAALAPAAAQQAAQPAAQPSVQAAPPAAPPSPAAAPQVAVAVQAPQPVADKRGAPIGALASAAAIAVAATLAVVWFTRSTAPAAGPPAMPAAAAAPEVGANGTMAAAPPAPVAAVAPPTSAPALPTPALPAVAVPAPAPASATPTEVPAASPSQPAKAAAPAAATVKPTARAKPAKPGLAPQLVD